MSNSNNIQGLIKIIGEKNWNQLSHDTQVGIQTSEICMDFLKSNCSSADFSASIMPLMRILEKEIIDNFYIPYLLFLNSNYTPATYIQINQLSNTNKNPNDIRKKILYYDDKKKKYFFRKVNNNKLDVKFYLGNFQFTVGAENYFSCDATAVQFYKTKFFPSANNNKITSWICNIANDIESLSLARNESAHAGYIKSIHDAENAMNQIIKTDKLLFQIINPTI